MSTETPSTDGLPSKAAQEPPTFLELGPDGKPRMRATPIDAPSQPPTVGGDDRDMTAQPSPTYARRALPLSSGTHRIKPGETYTVRARPQLPAFRPERFFVSGFEPAPTAIVLSPPPRRPWWKFWARRPNLQMYDLQSAIVTLRNELSELRARKAPTCGAGDWEILDITIGNKSQFAQAGALPGDMFSNLAIDSFVSFDTAQTAMDVCVTVTYRGPHKEGVPFSGGMLGTSAVFD